MFIAGSVRQLTKWRGSGKITGMKQVIRVVGAAFIKNGRLFAARRSYGSEYVVHKFEFVGGKIEDGESPEDAIRRECREELDLDIAVIRALGSENYEYPDKTVNITVFLCRMLGEYTVKEHEECRWIPVSELEPSDWAPADRGILEGIKAEFSARYSFVTGASGYIGKAFCRELAADGQDLFITGRSEEKLKELREELVSSYGITVRYFVCDLTSEFDRARLFSAASGYTFRRLINVAGADTQMAFCDYSEGKIIMQSRILFEAAVSLTRFCLESRTQKFNVINISSVSGLQPMPYFAIYSALKGALTSFSVALSRELKGTGAVVTAVLPGAVYTRPDVADYIKTQGLWGKIAAKSPEFVAKHSLKAAGRGKVKYIPGVANKLMRVFTALVPQGIKQAFIAKKWSKTRKDAF